MKDNHDRPVESLRISITDYCNLDCFYCHEEGDDGGDRKMKSNELKEIVQVGTEFGIEKVKLTGGEPLLRNDILEIVDEISSIDEITDVSITSNGTLLKDLAEDLKNCGLDRVNISLDTLDSEIYERITGVDKLEDVILGIKSSIDAGLDPVKLNTLVLDDLNDEEISDLVDFSVETGAILQLIEFEEVLPKNEEYYCKYHKSLDDIEKRIQEKAEDVDTRWSMQARRKYKVNGGEVEVVNPMHNSDFCRYCTRLRMDSSGYLKPCLMRNDNLVDVLTPIRNNDLEGVRNAYKRSIKKREPYFKDN